MVRALKTTLFVVVLAVCGLVIPDSGVQPTQSVLVKIDRAGGVDVDSDLIWILAVGSDARPGEDMTRVRGDALQLIGMNTQTGAATSIGIPRDSYVTHPGLRLGPGQRRALLRRPAAARRDRRRPWSASGPTTSSSPASRSSRT